MKIKAPRKGSLLVSDPNVLSDSSFSRSVILLSEHSPKGSVGFILNKPLNITLRDIFPDLDSNLRIYNGGPVEQENLYFIHNIPDVINNSIEISDGIYWGGDFDTLISLIREHKIKRTNIRFFLGYSGWEADQLETEADMESWIVIENTHHQKLLQIPSSTMWKELMIDLGDEYLIWANAPEDPVMN